jgi:Co/Zn/Cd efflux system component
MDPEIMIITATIGLCCNIINLVALGDCSCKEEEDEQVSLLNSITSVFKPNPLYYSIRQPKRTGQIRLSDDDGIPNTQRAQGSPIDFKSVAKVQAQSTQGTEQHSPGSYNKRSHEAVDLITSSKSDKLLKGFGRNQEEGNRNLNKSEASNINVRAAIVHMVGDLL